MKISILGTGAYGIALAKVLFNNGNTVSMWTKFQEELDIINIKRENSKVLPGIKINKQIKLTTDMNECIKESDVIVIAVPMNAVRSVSKELKDHITKNQVICITSKGIEESTNKFMSEVVYEETDSDSICIISGPSFAIELAQNAKLGLVAASKNKKASILVKMCVENDNITVNESSDIIGVQVCASIKNIFAIILGMLDGLNTSDSTRATMLTILLRDLKTIVETLEGDIETVNSYAGIGDFLLTCMSSKSRNYTFGRNIGLGCSMDKTLDNMSTTTVEGLYALKSAHNLLEKLNVPIDSINILNDIVFSKSSPEKILECIK